MIPAEQCPLCAGKKLPAPRAPAIAEKCSSIHFFVRADVDEKQSFRRCLRFFCLAKTMRQSYAIEHAYNPASWPLKWCVFNRGSLRFSAMRRNVVSICGCNAGFFLTKRRNARSNFGERTSSRMAHLAARKRAMALSSDRPFNLPERKALTAFFASAAVSRRHASMRRRRSRLSGISRSSAGKASAWVRTRSKVKAATSYISQI
jgi:hypothetical protein